MQTAAFSTRTRGGACDGGVKLATDHFRAPLSSTASQVDADASPTPIDVIPDRAGNPPLARSDDDAGVLSCLDADAILNEPSKRLSPLRSPSPPRKRIRRCALFPGSDGFTAAVAIGLAAVRLEGTDAVAAEAAPRSPVASTPSSVNASPLQSH
eukprot:TRINITY_DN30576_c0_g1_i1.p1 TRINITY_DN30576_c0_g1~~TRINITY_DN30576_c0_g1_i1.p1  ORF type:complete len:154 (+),score=26.89 TRINITY_DN30576_c0_g1_i1:57-518(+)